jgi:acetyl/propionyl-CoA carboxylase alpha subunit
MNDKLVRAVVNEDKVFDFDKDFLSSFDILELVDNQFHLIHNNRNFIFELIEQIDLKTYKVQIENRTYTITLKDQLDIMVDKLGLSAKATIKLSEIKAPMPGLVIDVLVKPGQTISKGDSLLILEAMKMENVIKSNGEGVIDEILVQKGNPVDKNQLLIKLK